MSLLRTAARVGVASSVHGRVQRRQSQRWAVQDTGQAPVRTPPPPPPAPVPSASPASTNDVLVQLTQLGQLRDAGVLTPAEFETQKARILA